MAEGIVTQIRKTPTAVHPLNGRHDFLVFDGKELTNDETTALLTQGVRDEITRTINRITGRVE
jgi:hypothetical protein